MNRPPPFFRLLALLCLTALLGAQVLGGVRGYLCDCSGSWEPSTQDRCSTQSGADRDQEIGRVALGVPSSNDHAPEDEDGCQCICHQIIVPLASESVRQFDVFFMREGFGALLDEFPPDAVPVGIEVPPQVA